MDRYNHQVLVIDDSPVDRLMLSSILGKEGYCVLTASNGPEGLTQAQEQHPDIVLLDVLMPGENGFEICARLKMDPLTSPIPVIFLSSENDKKSRIMGLNGGGVDYITKPFETEEVLARLRIHLRIRRAFELLVEQQQAQLSQIKMAQEAILVQPDEIPDAQFAVHYRPLHPAGGDFYDVIPFGEGINGYFSADICGHDLSAAFVTSALKVLIQQNFNPLYTPLETMLLLNSVLRPVLNEGIVISACCARLNRRSGRLNLVSAGHPPLIHLDASRKATLIPAEGDLLGAFDSPYFESVEYRVAKGDRIFFFSDGLIETAHGQNIPRQQGLGTLVDTLQKHTGLPLAQMVEETAYAICGRGEDPGDDLLLLGVEV